MSPLLRRWPWAALVALLLGCVASGALVAPTHVTQSAAFQEPILRAGGVAVVGLTGGTEAIDAAAQGRFASALAHRCKSRVPGLLVYGPASLRDADEAVLRDFASRDTIDPAALDDVQQRVYGARFLLAAQVLGNQVAQAEAESDDEVRYCSARAVTVRYRLFDLAEGGLAYAATHQETDQNCRRNARFSPGGSGGIGDAIASALVAVSLNAMVDRVKGTYPAAPATADLLERATREFVDAWPGARPASP